MLQAKSIVVVTTSLDPHADEVIKMLRILGHEPIRLHPEDIPLQIRMGLQLDSAQWTGDLSIQANGRQIDIEQIGSVWWRRPTGPILPSDLSKEEREFVRNEISHALHGFWATRDCYWMSYPPDLQLANLKPLQLQRAAKYGFEIPRTLITNDPQKVLAFYEHCNEQMIYKVFTDLLITPSPETSEPMINPPAVAIPKSTYTTLITKEKLSFIDTIKTSLCLFQEYIPKLYELRVTVIGDELFAAEIHSQSHESTYIDWRHYEVPIPYRKACLPADVAERCMAFVKSYHLNYSAMDLIVTSDGRYVFLENNPNGQFIFVERLIPEFKMTEALACCLIRGATS